MSWRDLKQPPTGDWYEMERPAVVETVNINPDGDRVILTFTDPVSREWFAEWLRSKHAWTAFSAWTAART
jgi:hypothetical protein